MAAIYGQLIKAQLEQLGSDPTPVLGQVWFNTGTSLAKFYDGATRVVASRDATETLSNKTLTATASITLAAAGAIDWAAGSVSLGASIGANTLTIGGASSTVRVPGTLSYGTATLDGDDFVLNNDAAGSGADWKLTLHRAALGMAANATITFPLVTGTLATLAGTETFTGKTLTGNTAVNLISGSGTLTLNTSGTVTLPNATDTLVGKATTDVLTNKDLTATTNSFTVAGASQAGIVSTTTQTFGGNKTFNGITTLGAATGEFTNIIQATNPTNATPALLVRNLQGTIDGTEEILRLNWDGTGSPNTGAFYATFCRNSTISGSVSVNGTGVLFNTTSDERLKNVDGPIVNALARVMSVDAVSYRWKETGNSEEGFTAQSLYTVFPHAVTAPKEGDWMVDYGRVTPLLWQALKELKLEVDMLKHALAACKEIPS